MPSLNLRMGAGGPPTLSDRAGLRAPGSDPKAIWVRLKTASLTNYRGATASVSKARKDVPVGDEKKTFKELQDEVVGRELRGGTSPLIAPSLVVSFSGNQVLFHAEGFLNRPYTISWSISRGITGSITRNPVSPTSESQNLVLLGPNGEGDFSAAVGSLPAGESLEFVAVEPISGRRARAYARRP